jgi:prepilin peptidase CpaA
VSLPALLVPDLLCVTLCVIATVTDLRDYRIPNWLTFGGMGLGLLVRPVVHGLELGTSGLVAGFVSSLAGGLLLLLAFGVLASIRFVGMGDAKLMGAVGTLLGWPMALWALVYVTISGGVIALAYALARGRLRAVLGNIFRFGRRLWRRDLDAPTLHRIPYALAILIGASWAAAIKYFPALRVP